MSHDLEASYAAVEAASYFAAKPAGCFSTPPQLAHLSVYAAREGKNIWPHADGVIALDVTSGGTAKRFNIAIEFKRVNEGVHGLLTAIGQSHAYLRKGYAGALIVVPKAYPTLPNAGTYIKEVIDLTSKAGAVGVFTYDEPELSKPSPFAGKLNLIRPFCIDSVAPIVAPTSLGATETQWAHVREGSTEPDALFKYLQSVKLLSGGDFVSHQPKIPSQLLKAIETISPGVDPRNYLANAPGGALKDNAWRHFWFKYVLHDQMLIGWNVANSLYIVNHVPSRILRADGNGVKNFFSGKTNSKKNSLVEDLNAKTFTESSGWRKLARNFRDRAHSYREDVDSGCEHLGFVDSEGRLTDSGYRFVDACERSGNPNSGTPRAFFMNALLTDGRLGAFLHYVYRLSEERFKVDPLAFTSKANGSLKFDQEQYLSWLEGEMANRLRVMRKVSTRGGVSRKPFQGELAVLRGLGIVGAGFRIGVGLPVNWPELQEALT